MEIELVSHASVIIRTSDTALWTDPWLFGKAFNDSWSLFPKPDFPMSRVDEISHLWISHEHPDHFHLPTLRALPEAFKKRVRLLFQRTNSDKMVEAFRRLGFENILTLPHRRNVPLTENTSVCCYQVGQMDSCLAVREGGRVVLNLNDAEVSETDLRILRRELGSPDVVLNQFSIAGYSGHVDFDFRLRRKAIDKLDSMVNSHRRLEAKTTIPFASFVYFSSVDNAYVNEYANRPRDVAERFAREGLELSVLFPGDRLTVGQPHDSWEALRKFDEAFAGYEDLPYDESEVVTLDEIRAAFLSLADHIHERFPRVLLRVLRPVTVRIDDLGTAVQFSIADRTFHEVASSSLPDLAVNSQPLHFALRFPWGVQTLGVSARLRLMRNERNWALHRILFSLNNAELYLKPRYALSWRNVAFARGRLRGGFSQVVHRLRIRRA